MQKAYWSKLKGSPNPILLHPSNMHVYQVGSGVHVESRERDSFSGHLCGFYVGCLFCFESGPAANSFSMFLGSRVGCYGV